MLWKISPVVFIQSPTVWGTQSNWTHEVKRCSCSSNSINKNQNPKKPINISDHFHSCLVWLYSKCDSKFWCIYLSYEFYWYMLLTCALSMILSLLHFQSHRHIREIECGQTETKNYHGNFMSEQQQPPASSQPWLWPACFNENRVRPDAVLWGHSHLINVTQR